MQTGAQRTTGWELGATGSPMRAWQVVAGVASQRATIVSTTSAAASGATVPLPGFTRLDAAAYVWLRRDVRLQVNVENLLDTRYYATSQGNDNIMPGAPRTLRISLSAGR